MIVLDKIKAFFKWYVEGMEHLGPKPEAKGAGESSSTSASTHSSRTGALAVIGLSGRAR